MYRATTISLFVDHATVSYKDNEAIIGGFATSHTVCTISFSNDPMDRVDIFLPYGKRLEIPS